MSGIIEQQDERIERLETKRKTIAQAFDSCDRILVEGAAATRIRAQAHERESVRRLRSSAMVIWAARSSGGEGDDRDSDGNGGGGGVLREYAKRCNGMRSDKEGGGDR